jgi:hypothetical protein
MTNPVCTRFARHAEFAVNVVSAPGRFWLGLRVHEVRRESRVDNPATLIHRRSVECCSLA